jgi:hypothetical protein
MRRGSKYLDPIFIGEFADVGGAIRLGSMPKAVFKKTQGELMMMEFCNAARTGRALDEHLMLFFSTAFEKILKSKVDPRKALMLNSSRGRTVNLEQRMVYIRIAYLVAQAMHSELSYEQAIEKVANDTKMSIKTIQKRYGQYKSIGRGLVYLFLKDKNLRKLSPQQINIMLGII